MLSLAFTETDVVCKGNKVFLARSDEQIHFVFVRNCIYTCGFKSSACETTIATALPDTMSQT